MKRKTRMKLCVCLILTSLASLVLGSACKNEATTDVKLVGFENATVQIVYRSDFSIGPYLSATDEQGNLYKGSAKITDSDGKQVELFANHFTVLEMSDYTAVITVKAGKQTFERKLTLDVVDKSTPIIKIYDLKYGQAGVSYTLPAVEISKFSDEEIEPKIEVYYLGETKSKKMEIENGAFMPQEKGLYKIVVTATDQYGTTNTTEKEFYVRSVMAKNMLEDFGDEVSVDNVTQTQHYKVGETTWYETYKGASGVVKTTTSKDYSLEYGRSAVALKTCKTTAELKNIDFDYINVRVWIDKEGSFTIGSNNNLFQTDVAGLSWQNVRLTKEAIETYNTPPSYKGSLYTQSLGENETPLDKFISYHNVNGTGNYLFYVQLLPDGYTSKQLLALKTENPALYEQFDKAKTGVDIYIDSIAYVKLQTEEYKTPQVNTPFTLPKVNLIGESGTKIDVNAKTTVTQSWDNKQLTVTDGKVTFPYSGTYYLNYSFNYGGLDYQSSVSIVIPRTLADGVLEDFNTPSATSGLRAGKLQDGGINVSAWLESYTIGSTTKQGVAKLEIGYNDGKAIFVNFGRTLAELKKIDDDSWDYIELSIAVAETGKGASSWISFSNWSQTFGANTGAWRTVKITKESVMGKNDTGVKNSYWSYLAGANDGKAIDKLWELHSAEGTGYKFCDFINTPQDLTEQEKANWKLTIYLDEIKLGKNA